MKNNLHIKNTVYASLFAALTCVAAVVIHFHLPISPHGCITLSDCIVLMAGILLGPLYGTAASGIGSALGDIIMGHISHFPGTLIIKALTAFVAYTLHKLLSGKNEELQTLPLSIACALAECVMVAGYLIYDTLIFGMNPSAALVSLPANLIQGVIGTMSAVILLKLMKKIKLTDIFI